jgi:tetratricopeptide (TPR) repeat protein
MAVAVVVVAGGLCWYSRRPKALDCATAARESTDAMAVVVCQQEYERGRRPATGALLANALRRSGDLTAAAALANELLATEARADGLYVLGQIAVTQKRLDDASSALEEARKLHRAKSQRRELAKDALALAEVQTRRNRYDESLVTLDDCIAEARSAPDTTTEGYCHLAAARVLAYVGYFDEARQELDRAEPQLAQDRDLAWLWHERGDLDQDAVRGPSRRGLNERAAGSFEKVLALATRAGIPKLVLTAHLNLAYSLAEIGKPDDAERHLAEAGVLDREGRYESSRAQLAARIAYRRGDLALASSINERVYPSMDGDDDDRIVIAVMQARIALASNDLAAAERWARRGVEIAEKMRAAQKAAELRPWVLASRREPFELLFKALALAGRTEDAITVFDLWQGRTLVDTMARPSTEPAQGLVSMATKIRNLGQWLPKVSSAPLVHDDGRAAIDTLRKSKIDLIALAVADGDVWRLTASRGRFRLDRLGPLDELRDKQDRFIAAPTDPALADELGALLLPGDVVRTTDEPLYVVLDAPLAALPFVALRHGGRPLIAARPVLRAPRLPAAASCGAHPDGGHTLILADAAGNLPDARKEAALIASQLKTTPLVGELATAAALLAAKPDSLLHVAVHAGVDAGGGVLKLYDRALSAPEITASRISASLVVLSGCSTAQAADPELAGSLSTAFLAGGSGHVIATLRPVSDPGALELTRRFYSSGGVADPVRALARIQAELAAGDSKDWPNFAAFGAEVCTAGS